MIKAVTSDQLSVMGRAARKTIVVAAAFSLFTFHFSLFTSHCCAAERETMLTSDTLEYFSAEKKYVARGSVKVEQEDVTVEADEMVYFEETDDVTAAGNVRYDDLKTFFTAKAADMNMKKKTGKLYDADMFFKDDNFYLSGREIERKSENNYYSKDETSFTTCDGPLAAWCFRGKDMDFVVGQRATAWKSSLRLRDIPVLYFPYFVAPVNNKRHTGFLIPTIINSSSRGLGLNIPFFWAIAENRDATFVFDVFSRSGIGTGMEYRFIEPHGLKSEWWLYHIYDQVLHRDFTEFRALHDDRSSGRIGLFLNANVVNNKDFFQVMSPYNMRYAQRFLETTAEVNIPFDNARAYFLGQYWIDLKYDTDDIPQKLPEIGYVMNYTRLGSFLVSGEAAAVNFRKKNGVSARRLDVYPTVLHAVGSDVVLSQIVAVRGTAYDFYHDAGSSSANERLSVEYDANIHARFFRRYDSFTHVIEPTIRYHYISNSPNDLGYTFDEWELNGKTSRLGLSLLNRILVKGKELVTARITQPLDMNNGDRPFRPLEFELATQVPVSAKVSTAYDVNTGKIQTVSSDIGIPFHIGVPFPHGSINFGQRYNMPANIMVFWAGVAVRPVKPIQVGLDVRYDAKGEGLRAVNAHMQYTGQCWGFLISAAKTPDNFSVKVMVDLYGVTAKPPVDK